MRDRWTNYEIGGDRPLSGVRVALVYPPYGAIQNEPGIRVVKENYGLFPNLSLLYVAGTLENAGCTVLFVDAHAEGLTLEQTIGRLRRFRPHFVGYTITTYLFHQTLRWIRAIKRAWDVPVITGGVHMGIYPVETLQHPAIDYGVTGEAETSLVPLLVALSRGALPEDVPGVVYRDETGRARLNPPAPPLSDVDTAPFPARHLIDNRIYYSFVSKYRNFSPIITSRGCPYRCIFCEQGSKAFRGRSAQNVADELEVGYREHDIREFDFFDSSFTIDKARVLAVCDEIRKRGLNIAWSARTRPDCVDRDMLRAMARAGCMRIYYGIESGNPRILATLRKHTDLARIREVLQETRRAGIDTFGYFMVGSPGETRATVEETIRFAIELDLDYAQFSKVTPMPATELYDMYLAETGHEFWRTFILDESADAPMKRPGTTLTEAEVTALTREAYLRFYFRPRYVARALLRVKSADELTRYVRTAWQMVTTRESSAPQGVGTGPHKYRSGPDAEPPSGAGGAKQDDGPDPREKPTSRPVARFPGPGKSHGVPPSLQNEETRQR